MRQGTMLGYRWPRGLFAAMALLSCFAASAADEAPEPVPGQWASYIASARRAEQVADAEQRCLQYPDVPGNQWPEGAAIARCALLRKPLLSIDAISGLLDQEGGARELERRYATLLEAHYADPAQREQIFVSFKVFDGSAASGKVAQVWRDAAPESAYAAFALGRHHAQQGWTARGQKLGKDTSRAQLDEMTRHFAAAVPLLLEAMRREPRLSPACVEATAIGRMSSDELQQAALAQCLDADPASYHLVLEWIFQAQPKWGGSLDALRQVVAYAAARIKQNPMLGALLAQHAGYEPMEDPEWKTSREALLSAAMIAPDHGYLGESGIAHGVLRDPWPSIAYSMQALRFRENPRYAYRLAKELNGVREHASALRHAEQAAALEPENGRYHYELGRTRMFLEGQRAARPSFRRAMEDPDVREDAALMWCQTFSARRETSEALACTKMLVTDYPEAGESWRLRASALGAAGDSGLYDAIDRFLATMDVQRYPFQASWAEDYREFKQKMPREKFSPGSKLYMESE